MKQIIITTNKKKNDKIKFGINFKTGGSSLGTVTNREWVSTKNYSCNIYIFKTNYIIGININKYGYFKTTKINNPETELKSSINKQMSWL